ncbi:MAG: hypothetical protein IPJ38_21485 [Dechloromonas sp.]|uniref:Transglycosylase SLT domain-containing protein n=1 Tax=Candidatus Dechloromonas phosphorivorans TaxID=2899244 RepID=A0A935K0P1_9RHOO|nr:hypothetical protein [Candidatus Dechloromonas phosphorivorans]
MENLDTHPVLASVAYNAGPGRAKNGAEQALEGAISAETIPFSETRDSVKKSMSNPDDYLRFCSPAADSLKTTSVPWHHAPPTPKRP